MELAPSALRRHRLPAVAALVMVAVCSGDAGASAGAGGSAPDEAPSGRCIVRLHGKGGTGGPAEVDAAGVTNLMPNGNAEGWGGRQWLYFPDDQYAVALQIVVDAAEGCEEVMLAGFSNGASFAAKLYCRGEDLDGRLVRAVVDDPVPDSGVDGCDPSPEVDVALYWTGALEATAQPGWECGASDWTCEGGTTIGIDAYAAALGTAVLPSGQTEHTWYWDAPALADWTRRGADSTVAPGP